MKLSIEELESVFFGRVRDLLAVVEKYDFPDRIKTELEHLASESLKRVWHLMPPISKGYAIGPAHGLFIREPCIGDDCWEKLSNKDKPIWSAFTQSLIDLKVGLGIQNATSQKPLLPDVSSIGDLSPQETTIAEALEIFGKPGNLPIQHLSDILYFHSEFNNGRWSLLSSVDKFLWLSKYQKPDVANLIRKFKGGGQLIEAINAFLGNDEFKGIKIKAPPL
jgi:hypothetical protein